MYPLIEYISEYTTQLRAQTDTYLDICILQNSVSLNRKVISMYSSVEYLSK